LSFLKEFSIQFASLNPGNYEFKFVADEKFFEKFDESEVRNGHVNIAVDLEKQARMLILNFVIEGTVKLICDRCLDEYDQQIHSEERLIVKLGKEMKEETEEIIMIPESDHSISLIQFIYEFIHLALPTKRVHPLDNKGKTSCDKDVIKKLEDYEKTNNNEDEKSDPRWDALKNIKFN